MSKRADRDLFDLRRKLSVERDDAVMRARAEMLVPARVVRDIVEEFADAASCPSCGEDWPWDGGDHTEDCRWRELTDAVKALLVHDLLGGGR